MSATPVPTEMPFRAEVSPTPSPSANSFDQWQDSFADWLNEWQGNVFSLGFVNTVIFAAIVVGIAFVVLWVLRRFLKPKMTGNLNIFYRLIKLAVIVIAVSSILSTITPLKELNVAILASSGIAAVVLGLAAQQTLGNVFSGISISVAKPFKVGEHIEILGVTPPLSGTVKALGLRHTVITDLSNKDIVIPNSVLDKEMIRTAHTLDESSISSFFDVSISYSGDMDAAIAIIEKLVAQHPDAMDARTPEEKKEGVPRVVVQIVELGESAVKLRAYVWTRNTRTGLAVLSDLRYAVIKEFDQAGIEIPYPYRNVVVKHEEQ